MIKNVLTNKKFHASAAAGRFGTAADMERITGIKMLRNFPKREVRQAATGGSNKMRPSTPAPAVLITFSLIFAVQRAQIPVYRRLGAAKLLGHLADGAFQQKDSLSV